MKWLMGNRVLMVLVYSLITLALLYMLLLIQPLLGYVFTFLKAVLGPFLIAMIISYVLNPIVSLLNHRKVPRTAAVLLIYAVFITTMTVVVMNIIPMFMKQLRELNDHMPELSMKAQSLVSGMNNSSWVPDSVQEGINHALHELEDGIARGVSNFVNGIGATINILFIAFIIPFLVFYMLKDFRLMEETALTFIPNKHRTHIIKLLKDIDSALGNYVRGQFIVCVVVGVLAYIGYWIIDMPYPLLLASMVTVFNIIPYLGPFFGAAPAIIMASTISMKMMLLVSGINLCVQVLEGNVISPQVVGRTLHMHPLLIIFVLLVGGELAGIVGLILAVPFFAVLKVIFQHMWVYYNNRKAAEIDTT
ncbi:MAG: AI-2E family transporter [Paenibacillaceae bacterium]